MPRFVSNGTKFCRHAPVSMFRPPKRELTLNHEGADLLRLESKFIDQASHAHVLPF